jgi:hypothetical protein
MCRQVVENNVNLLVGRTLVNDLREENDKFLAGVARRRSAMNFSCLSIKRCVQRKRSMPVVLEAMALGPSRTERHYCGLCGAENSSAETVKRMPISKQRNKHIQSVLVEAAKLAPRQYPEFALLYEKEKQKGNANQATLAVARKMVAYLLAVDRRGTGFEAREQQSSAA